jgi:hypothetical protein
MTATGVTVTEVGRSPATFADSSFRHPHALSELELGYAALTPAHAQLSARAAAVR